MTELELLALSAPQPANIRSPSIYRYFFGSLLTEQVIDEFPLYGVWMSMEINVGGQFTGTFQLDQTGRDNSSMMGATLPGKTWVAVERNGVCVWHGFVWTRTYSAQSKTVQIQAQSFEYYPKKRKIEEDLTYVAVEQRNIFRELWTNMQSGPNENLNINVPDAFPDVVTKDLTVLASDHKYYDDVMSSIADADDGFDWIIKVSRDGDVYRKDISIGYPTIGSVEHIGMVTFEYPGNITQYYITDSMTQAGTHVHLIGGGEGSTMVVGTSIQTDMLSQGFPRWDFDLSRKDITSQTIIDSLAAQEGAKRKPPMPILKLTLKGDLTPEFGSYNLGDMCKIYIKDPRFPDGFTGTKRLLKWELHPKSSDSTEEANLSFEGDPDE